MLAPGLALPVFELKCWSCVCHNVCLGVGFAKESFAVDEHELDGGGAMDRDTYQISRDIKEFDIEAALKMTSICATDSFKALNNGLSRNSKTIKVGDCHDKPKRPAWKGTKMMFPHAS